MEEKLMNLFGRFCKWECKYRGGRSASVTLDDPYCPVCDNDISNFIEVCPCDYCQIKEFIKDVAMEDWLNKNKPKKVLT